MVSSCLCSGGGCWQGDSGDRVPRAGRVTAALPQEFLAAGGPGSCCLEEPAQHCPTEGLGAHTQCGQPGVCESTGTVTSLRQLLQSQNSLWASTVAKNHLEGHLSLLCCQLSAAPWLALAVWCCCQECGDKEQQGLPSRRSLCSPFLCGCSPGALLWWDLCSVLVGIPCSGITLQSHSIPGTECQGCASPRDGEAAAFAIKWFFFSGTGEHHVLLAWPGVGASQGSPNQPQHAPSS